MKTHSDSTDTVWRLQKIYHRINRYQTRLIRLYGDDGAPDSPLVCDLYTADILHPDFEGLGLRLPPPEADSAVPYDALSYAWGSEERTECIICNSVPFPVTRNLFEALLALRFPKQQFMFLWVDAICINQSDDKEKSDQVRNMLRIYQKAKRVIAWLGAEEEDIDHLLDAASVLSSPDIAERNIQFWKFHARMTYLYTRPWFRRLWVLQEVFAAKELILQCGSHQWHHGLAAPNVLCHLQHLEPYRRLRGRNDVGNEITLANSRRPIAQQLAAISELDKLHEENLRCYELFSPPNRWQPDFINTLFDTAFSGAKEPKDHIYGIVGMTGFPAVAMPFDSWSTDSKRHSFIPIDYSADFNSILCAVSRYVLMKGGLFMLAKFKAFAANEDGQHEYTLPSWVIDWRLSARLLHHDQLRQDTEPDELDHALDQFLDCLGFPQRSEKPPVSHEQFLSDNENGSVLPTKLILRGTPDLRFYAKDNCVWQSRPWLSDRVVWRLECHSLATDLVVRFHAFFVLECKPPTKGQRRRAGRKNGTLNGSPKGLLPVQAYDRGFWLIRPVKGDEYQLIACLLLNKDDLKSLYPIWQWAREPEQSTMESTQGVSPQRYRKLSVYPEHDMDHDRSIPEDFMASADVRTFTIV